MENRTITTPSGYKVTIKSGLTFQEKRQIQRVYADKTVLNQQTGKYEVKGSAVYDAEDETLRLMVILILDKSDQDITSENPLAVVRTWSDADQQAVYAAVDTADQATSLTEEQKKTPSSNSSNSTATDAAKSR